MKLGLAALLLVACSSTASSPPTALDASTDAYAGPDTGAFDTNPPDDGTFPPAPSSPCSCNTLEPKR